MKRRFLAAGFSSALALVALPAVETGPEVGSKIPAIRAIDQNGREQDFHSLTGPKGLMLVFFRSADW
ncbi:MAG: hypothetical protein ABI165_19265 [Bryobacteraceae bacterium]